MAGPTLLLATSNPGKRAELAQLLPADVRLLTLEDVDLELPPETGGSFVEIASVKARFAAEATGYPAFADDSGLEVDALGGAPGLRSARFAGEPASDAENRSKLLALLAPVPSSRRSARFRCAVVLAEPGRVVATAEGTCEGTIAFEERGRNGFGYDPLFLLPDGRTMAELEPEEKSRISHRGRALVAIRPEIDAFWTARAEGRR
jgi:XTP/dITP diphosphohydrolase